MTEFTYATLLSAVQDATEERGTDFTNYLPVALEIVEQRLARRLDNVGMVSVAYTTLPTAVPYIAKPNSHMVTRSVNYVSAGRRRPLIQKERSFVVEYWPERTSVGRPKYYTNWSDDYILIAPADYNAAELEMEYEVFPSALTSANPQNWYTKYAGAALFAGMMVEANKFIKNFEIATYWDTQFDKEVTALQIAAKRGRRDDDTAPENPITANNLTGS